MVVAGFEDLRLEPTKCFPTILVLISCQNLFAAQRIFKVSVFHCFPVLKGILCSFSNSEYDMSMERKPIQSDPDLELLLSVAESNRNTPFVLTH